MISPKRYLEDLLRSKLEDYVQDGFQETLVIGMFVGDVRLTNLCLKRQEWEIAPGLRIELAHGTIENVELQVPWIDTLRTGGIKGVVKNCRLVFRLISTEYDEDTLSRECILYAEKMNKLELEECKLLTSPLEALDNSWMSRTVESLSSKYLKQLASGFSLRFDNVQCSLLLPNGGDFDDEEPFEEQHHQQQQDQQVSAQKDDAPNQVGAAIHQAAQVEPSQTYLHLIARFDSLDIGQLRSESVDAATSMLLFTKDVSLRGLSIRVGCHSVEVHDIPSEYEALFSNCDLTHPVFINPLNISAEIKGGKPDSPDNASDEARAESVPALNIISIDIKASNFEATPKVEQVHMIKTAVDHIRLSHSKTLERSKSWELHPIFLSHRSGSGIRTEAKITARERWKFAHLAVVKSLREKREKAVADSFHVSERFLRSFAKDVSHREQPCDDLEARRNVLIVELKSIGLAEPDAVRVINGFVSSTSKEEHLEEAVKWAVDEVRSRTQNSLLYSAIYRKSLESKLDEGAPTLSALEMIRFEEIQRLSTLEELLSSRTAVLKSLCSDRASRGNLQRALLPSDEYQRLQSHAEDSEEVEYAPKKSLPGYQVYGWDFKIFISRFAVAILSPVTDSRLTHDTSHVRAFSLILYGLKSEKITSQEVDKISLTVGTVCAYGLGSEEVLQCGGDPHCWLEDDARIDEDTEDVAFSLNSSEAEHEGERICVNTLAVAEIHFKWHQASMNFLRDFCDTLNFSGDSTPTSEASRQRLFLSQRWNLKATLQGLHFNILNFENGFQLAAPQNFNGESDHLHIKIRFGRVSAFAGDYTDNWFNDHDISPEDSAGQEALRATAAKAIQNQNVHTLVYNLDCIEVMLARDLATDNDSDVRITRIPWSLSGALSLSKFPGDERYADVRVDILCSRLDLILSVGSTITLIGCANQVAETLFSLDVQNALTQRRNAKRSRAMARGSGHKRLADLVGLCKFHLNIRFSASNVALTSDQQNMDHLLFASEVLRSFAGKVVSRGELSQVMQTKRRLLVIQLRKLGIKDKEVAKIIDDLMVSIRDNTNLDDAVNATVEDIRRCTKEGMRYVPIIDIEFGKSSGIVLNQLTYDYKLQVNVKKFLVTGPSHIPLFQVYSVGNVAEKVNVKTKKRENQRAGGKKGGGVSSSKEDYMIEYIETDSGFEYGKMFKDAALKWANQGATFRKRDGSLTVKAESINVLLPTDIIPLLGKMIHASDRISRYLEYLRTDRRKSTETFATRLDRNSSNSNFLNAPSYQESKDFASKVVPAQSPPEMVFRLSMDLTRSIEVVLSHGDNLLALMTLLKGHITAHLDFQFMTGKITTNFSTIQLFDLSEVGSLHPTIIWPKSENSKPNLDINVQMALESSESQTCYVVAIDVTLNGVRICLLYRFLQELVSFVTLVEKMYSDLMLKRQRAFAHGPGLPSSELESMDNAKHENLDELESSASDADSSSDDSDDSSLSSSSSESVSDIPIRTPFRQQGLAAGGGKKSSSVEADFQSTQQPFDPRPAPKQSNEVNLPHVTLVRWKVNLNDFVVVCPRNSSSRDLLALTVNSGIVFNSFPKSSWQAPTADEVKEPADRKTPLYFNPVTNVWMRKVEHEDDFSMTSWDVPLVSEPSTSMGTDGESLYADSSRYQSAYRSFGSAATDRFGTPRSAGMDEPSRREEDERQAENLKVENAIPRISIELKEVSAYVSLGGRLVNFEHTGEILVDTEKVKEFNEVSDGRSVHFIKHKRRDESGGSAGSHGSQSWRKVSPSAFNLLVVVDFLPENQSRILMSDTSDLSSLSLSLTMAELYLLQSIWFDNIFEAPLFFTRNASPRDHELQDDFGGERKAFNVEIFETRSKQSNDTTASSDSARVSSAPTGHSNTSSARSEVLYGTKEYFKAMRRQQFIGEFLLVRADIKLECFIEIDYFVKELPSQVYLRAKEVLEKLETELKEGIAGRPGLQSSIKMNEACQTTAFPISRVSIEGLVLHNRALQDNTTELAMGAGLLEIFDTRVPKQGVYDKVLRIGTLNHSPGEEPRRVYGYADFEYGLKMNPSDVVKCGDIPLKVNVINSEFWTTVHVGADGLELNLKNLELVFLIVDYFASYFQYPEFGHPFVAAYERLPESKKLYRGVDTRVFATRPHICIMEDPMNHNSGTLVLETDAGVFYRQVMDNKLSKRIEVKVLDVALVAHQRFSSHDRGLRGSAGSGTGIRTLIEFLDCDYSQHFIASMNHMDIQFCLLENSSMSTSLASEATKTDDQQATSDSLGDNPFVPAERQPEYVDFEAERLTLKPAELFVPKCTHNFSDDLKKEFPERSCHIVASYEDILFTVDLVTNFIMGKAEVSLEEDDKNTKKNKKKGPGREREKKPVQKEKQVEVKGPAISIFATVSICGVRIIVVDNVLGLHLPLLQIFLMELKLTFDKSEVERQSAPALRLRAHASEVLTPRQSSQQLEGATKESSTEDEDTTSLKLYAKIRAWSDYFNNLKKCWEPLLEKVVANALYEKSPLYGQGLTLRSESDIHVNISGAFFRTLNDLIRMYKSAEESYGAAKHPTTTEEPVVSTPSERNLPVQWCPLLPEGARFGFAIQNSTGQPLRFIQQKDGGKNTISFVDDGERGALNFVATTSRIRNQGIERDAFNVQQERRDPNVNEESRSSKPRTKKSLCLQISGYKAIPSVEADGLGVKYQDLVPIDIERKNKWDELLAATSSEKVRNALKLVAEVVSMNRGRLLHLRSVFTVKNNTSHAIEIKSSVYEGSGRRTFADVISSVELGGNLYVPLALLQRSAQDSLGTALGTLKIRPVGLKPVEDELGSEREDIKIGMDVDYSTDVVDLHETVERTDYHPADSERSVGTTEHVVTDIAKGQLCCVINPKLKKKTGLFDMKGLAAAASSNSQSHFNKLPLFCYNIEIQRIGELKESAQRNPAKLGVLQAALRGRLFQSREDRADSTAFSPVHYNIIVHPPIVLESMLPWHGHFEILHANTSRLLWSSLIEPGKAKPIHTVTLDEPLRLRIHLKYCRTGNPVLFHTPLDEDAGRTFVGRINEIQKTVEGFLVETDSTGEDASIELADSLGQRLRLNIENVEGGGGERHIVVYCPYWIVNTSQYKLRLREEGSPKDQLPAGTETSAKDGTLKDGTRPVAYGSVKQWPDDMGKDTIFPGKIPPLHTDNFDGGQVPNEDDLRNMLLDLPFDEIVKYAYMYNYPDSHSLGKRRVCVQIDDSEWSQGFSLDSVGTPIPLSIEHTKNGLLELGYKIKVAPGRLGKYTKIVRFMPRFVIMNRLDTDLKIVQPTGFVGELLPVQVKAKHFVPYHLPAVFGERALAIELDGPWTRTVFFDIEAIGTSTLRVIHKLDLGAVEHVNTRGLPHYEVFLRPEHDVGIWFETDWEEKNIVVKSFRHGSFAHIETDIQTGDVVVGFTFYTVDPRDPFYDQEQDTFEDVTGRDFEKVMKLMKERETPMRLKIRTVEENIRRLRREQQQAAELINKSVHRQNEENIPNEIALRLEVRQVEATIFIVIDVVDIDKIQSEYMLENYSVTHIIHYKQKGATGNNWCSLFPGQSISYIWEDPFKPHKLLLKAGRNILSPKSSSQIDSDFFPGDLLNRTQGVLGFIAGVAADEFAVISLDEIGTKDREVALPNGAEGKLFASVNIKNGSTKTLIISHDKSSQSQQMLELAYCSAFIKMQHEALVSLKGRCLVALKEKDEFQRTTGNAISAFYQPLFLQTLEDLKSKQEDLKQEMKEAMKDHPEVVLSSYLPFESLCGQRIERKHQIMVEILEAKDLRQFLIGKFEDTYCSVQLRIGRRYFQGQAQPKYTNVCEQNMNPTWIGQRFIFDVPDFEDVSTKIKARDVKIRVNVISKTLIRPFHRFLGQADIQFSCLKQSGEEEVKGYFLLRPEAHSVTAAKMVDVGGSGSGAKMVDVSGSIKMCLRWIHSDEGLLKYNVNVIDARLSELEELGKAQRTLYQYADAAHDKSNGILTLFQSERTLKINMQTLASGTLSLAGGIAGGTLSIAGGLAGSALRMPGELVRGLIQRKSVADVDSSTKEAFVPTLSTIKAQIAFEPTLSAAQVAEQSLPQQKSKPKSPRQRANTKAPHNPSRAVRALGLDEESGSLHNFQGRRSIHGERLGSLINPHDESTSRSWVTKRNRLVSKVMDRRPETIADCDSFSKRFEEECRAAYMLVHTQKGRILVTPIAAHNLPDKHKRKVFVRFSYGDVMKTTISKPNSADLSWSNEDLNFESSNAGVDAQDVKKDDKKSLKKVFDIETLNIKSSLLVQVMEEGLRKSKEIARLEIPIFNLLDCLCHTPTKDGKDSFVERSAVKVEENVYEMWFAMTPTDDLILGEGDTDLVQRSESEQQDYMAFSKGSDYKPCVQLRFKFVKRDGDEPKEEKEDDKEKDKEKPGDRNSSLYFRLQIPSLSVSIVDSDQAREVMQCSIRGVECRHAVSRKFVNSSLNVMWLQVDNQLPDPISAIILAPAPSKSPEPTIRINIRKDNELSREGLTSYDFIVVQVVELDLSLEQQTVVASWALIKNWFQEQASSSSSGETAENGSLRRDFAFHDLDQLGFATCKDFIQYDLYDLLPTLVSNLASEPDATGKRAESKLYISFINIADVRINVSFIMNPKLQQSAGKVEKLQQASWSDDIDLLSSITFFLSQIGVVALDLTSSISDAPITFAEFQREKIFETDTEVEKRLRQHYLYSALTQLYKIVGSLELVGNPVGLVTSLGIGVTDFFYEPYHALITNPTDIGKLGRGLAKGALSVVSNTTEGFIGTGTTVTRSLGRIGARFAMDPTYVIAREELQRQPRTPAEAVYRPFRDIGNGVYYGVVGLVKVPYNNYRRHRALGILPGIAKGLGGLLAKTVVGVVDAITHTGDAARELVRAITRDQNPPVRRLRLRNQFGPDGRLLPYSYAAALGMHATQALDRARLESVGNAINESVGFVTSMGRMIRGGGRGPAAEAPINLRQRSLRRNSLSGLDSPLQRVRSNSFSFGPQSSIANTTSSDSYDEKVDGGTDGNTTNAKVEFVIHTFMKKMTRSTEKKRSNSYQLVIVTTTRVLVSEYIKKKRGASQFVRRWETDMRYLKPPKLEKRKAGGYLLTLSSTKVAETEILTAIAKGPMIIAKSGGKLEGTRESSDFTIESTQTEDDGSVLELYNCIAIAKTHTELEIRLLEQTKIQNGVVSYGENIECEGDEHCGEIFKIGPWEYSNGQFDSAEEDLVNANALLTTVLEGTVWNMPPRTQDTNVKDKNPTWLENERQISVNAHKEARESAATMRRSTVEDNITSTDEAAGAEVRKSAGGYLKGGFQAAQSMLVSSARSIERAVTAVSSVALSPAVSPRTSGSSMKSQAEPPAHAHAGESTAGISPKGILSGGLSPKNGDKKKGISFDFDVRERLRVGSRSPFEAVTEASTTAKPQITSPIANGSPTTPNTNGSLAKLFSPFPASSSPPAPLLAPVQSVSSAATPLAATAAATQGQDESGGSFNTLISDVASQAGTVNTQDSEAMAQLHGRLDRLEALLLAALASKDGAK